MAEKKQGWLEQLQKSKAKKVDFSQFGFPDFFVLLIHPATKPQEWLENFSKMARPAVTSETMTPEEASEIFQAQKKLIADLILDWNLTHPETGEPLKLPNKDKSSLDCLPVEFTTHLTSTIGELLASLGPPTPSG